jgi:hypothetical protein
LDIFACIALALFYFLKLQSLFKAYYLKQPVLTIESTVTVTPLNVQDNSAGSFYLIPHQNSEFVETKQSFGFIFNTMMMIPVPKRLFKTPAEIDEFIAFVKKNN